MIRAVARITIGRGQGRGAVLGIVRLRPAAGNEDSLRIALRERLDPKGLDGIISMHLIESDPELSKPLTDQASASDPGAGDWFVLIDATNVNAASTAIAARLADGTGFKSAVISSGIYRLMWDLAKNELSA
jgi:hypothetical protein